MAINVPPPPSPSFAIGRAMSSTTSPSPFPRIAIGRAMSSTPPPIPLPRIATTDQRSLLHGRPAPSCQRRRPGVVVLWIRRVAVVYECDAWHNWASGQSVQFSQCVNGAWTAVDDTCAVSLALDGPPCSDEPRLPAHAVETKALVHSGQRWAVQYECELGYTWPRGRRLRETTCDGGAWTEIHHDCSLGLLSGELSCADPPSPPNKSFITEAWNVSGVNVGVMFRCETGFGWASGRWANFAQCLNNSWAEVDDVCSPGVFPDDTPCPDPPPKPCNSVKRETWEVGGLKVGVMYECRPGFVWASGKRAHVTQCVAGQWTQILDVCFDRALVTGTTPCPYSELENVVLVHIEEPDCSVVPPVLGHYECIPGYQWFSGAHVHDTHCPWGSWQPILDYCTPANGSCAKVLRDCADILTQGYEESGTFRIYPSGNVDDRYTQVSCRLADSSTFADGGWTPVAFFHSNSARHPIDREVLANLSRGENNDTRLLTFQFTFLTVDQLLYHATYGSVNLTVDLAVEDVGVYHGNAGEFKTVYDGL
ncbi:hypothetical protein C7M84_025512 [Penaeus vannamei]|uniref:Sushi domain-containing protein n=1 Tax=Penaeus vannamei TaxID=6689 RepID=A0A3R7PYT0_PENVA|nr:hypothetical protein C7M84_025512 [Penaeus vannamei]